MRRVWARKTSTYDRPPVSLAVSTALCVAFVANALPAAAQEIEEIELPAVERRGELADIERMLSGEDAFVGPLPPQATAEAGAGAGADNARPPIAEDINLAAPVALEPDADAIDIGRIAPPAEPVLMDYGQPSLFLLGTEVAPSTSARLSWLPDISFASIAVPTPVLVVNGSKTGPTMCVTAAIHGDELNGIEVVRRVLYDLDSEKLSGAVIGVPIVNLQGFRRASRYLPDRRDLNRFFPGNASGSSASRLANSFFDEVISHCDSLIDLHTGSFHRTNLPQLRADLQNPEVVKLTKGFGSTVVLHSPGAEGTLRKAATDAGIPTVTLEAGEPARVQEDAVTHGTKGVMTLLNKMGMYDKVTRWGNREPVYYRSKWVRADRGGVLFSDVELGDKVQKDQLLGTVTDPITNVKTDIRATQQGRILGMAVNQFVLPGFAAYRIGIENPNRNPSGLSTIGMPDDFIDTEKADHVDDAPGMVDNFDADEEILDARDSLEDSE